MNRNQKRAMAVRQEQEEIDARHRRQGYTGVEKNLVYGAFDVWQGGIRVGSSSNYLEAERRAYSAKA